MKNATASPPIDHRLDRYVGRHHLRSVTTVSRCFDCGRAFHESGSAVQLRVADGVSGYAGLVTCGRVWLCPVCNSKVMARRALEIGAALSWASSSGLQIVWGSLTCWHNRQSRLSDLLELQRSAWRSVVNSKGWRKSSATRQQQHAHGDSCELGPACELRREVVDLGLEGRVGYMRAGELNIGPNGWHPHFHPLVLVRGSQGYAAELAARMVEEWVLGVEAAGGEAQRDGAQQLRVVAPERAFEELAGYVTKQTYGATKSSSSRSMSQTERLALEAVWSQSKNGRGRPSSTVAHWSILEGIGSGLVDDVDLWLELEAATVGHRMLTWSRGLRSFAGLAAEVDDEELAAEELGTELDTVAFITTAGWLALRDRPRDLAGILRELETGGWSAARARLDLLEVEYETLEVPRAA